MAPTFGHIVLRVGDTSEWPANRVLMTWQTLYSLPLLCDRYLKGEINTVAELKKVKEKIIWKDFSAKTKRKWTIGITLKPQLE